MNRFFLMYLAFTAGSTFSAPGILRYVDINSPTPTAPYTNWTTAATNIQDAITVALAADEIVVADGVYATGGVASGDMTNRVYIDRPITVRSFNGPEKTIIQGAKSGADTNGPGAVRCAFIFNQGVLSGFTLTGGGTTAIETFARGGGVYCLSDEEVLTNCVLVGNSAGARGGGAYKGTLRNCLIASNSAPSGGGAYMSTAENCTFLGNSAGTGGGACEATLSSCLLIGNWGDRGGGAAGGRMDFCTVAGNRAKYGGGMAGAPGAAAGPIAYNSILYYNQAAREGENWNAGKFRYCCTTPLPTNGLGSITTAPELASLSHLSSGSPCRGAAQQVQPIGTDVDGEPWATNASIGCDEYYEGSVTGALTVAISAAWTNFARGYSAGFVGLIEGRVSASLWNFGDGTVVSNRPVATHVWNQPGLYEVTLTAFNESFLQGVCQRVLVKVNEPVTHYVAINGTNPAPPYASWENAALNLQSAIDVSAPGDDIQVSDGIYGAGCRSVDGYLTNRVVVDKPLTIRSANGPAKTAIYGFQTVEGRTGQDSIRCLWLTNNTLLSGFTLAFGATRTSNDEYNGGGAAVWCASTDSLVQDCVLISNTASLGTVCGGTVKNCVLARNTGGNGAAGGYWCRMDNCTIVGNKGYPGYYGAINNSIIYSNTPGLFMSASTNCCINPLPYAGVCNFTNAPLFADFENLDLRLQPGSPCINSGRNSIVDWTTDLNGNPRISAGTVDAGAYEFQSPASRISYVWLDRWSLPYDGSADAADVDQDGMNTFEEWRADTVPTDSSSLLKVFPPVVDSSTATIVWSSSTNRSYNIERLNGCVTGGDFAPIGWGIPGGSNMTAFTVTNAMLSGSVLYRVRVCEP